MVLRCPDEDLVLVGYGLIVAVVLCGDAKQGMEVVVSIKDLALLQNAGIGIGWFFAGCVWAEDKKCKGSNCHEGGKSKYGLSDDAFLGAGTGGIYGFCGVGGGKGWLFILFVGFVEVVPVGSADKTCKDVECVFAGSDVLREVAPDALQGGRTDLGGLD